jgi:hypothetical protein
MEAAVERETLRPRMTERPTAGSHQQGGNLRSETTWRATPADAARAGAPP